VLRYSSLEKLHLPLNDALCPTKARHVIIASITAGPNHLRGFSGTPALAAKTSADCPYGLHNSVTKVQKVCEASVPLALLQLPHNKVATSDHLVLLLLLLHCMLLGSLLPRHGHAAGQTHRLLLVGWLAGKAKQGGCASHQHTRTPEQPPHATPHTHTCVVSCAPFYSTHDTHDTHHSMG
jgi:hypothetical protein